MQTSAPSYFTNLAQSPVANKYPQYKLSQIPSKMPKVEALEKRLKEPNTNPVSVLNEIAGPALQYYIVEERGEKQQKEFVIKVTYKIEADLFEIGVHFSVFWKCSPGTPFCKN